MKKIAILILISTGVYCTLMHYPAGSQLQSATRTATSGIDEATLPALRIVFFQDCSPSILQNGVEIITSSVFTPYYENIHRSIELNVGFIGDVTAGKLITLLLQPPEFQKPLPVDMRNVPITQQRKVQMEYLASICKYEADSATFYASRAKQISQFRQQIDTVLNGYRRRQSKSTDLAPVGMIADKVFNYSAVDGAENVLILNSDGIDSHRRVARPMKNKAITILVNANGMAHTSLDSIVTNTLQSPEQAIQLSLLNTKKH